MNDIDLVVEVGESSVDIVEFKTVVGGYLILVEDSRSQVGADDLDMGKFVGYGCAP